MAGTGHRYEIANMRQVRHTIASLQEHCRTDEARAWFSAPRLVKFLTAEAFTATLGEGSGKEVEEWCDPGEREFLLRKLDVPGAVRLFLQPSLGQVEADLENVAHWASTLSGREADKLLKMAVPDAIGHSRKWIKLLNADRNRLSGSVRCALSFIDGWMWVQLLDADALRSEASAMSHCVGDTHYALALEDGHRFYSLRSNGKSRVTAYVRVARDGGLTLAEVRGRGNTVLGFEELGYLCDLLDTVGATMSKPATMAGIVHADGRWRRLAEIWKKMNFNGYTAAVEGNQAIIMSPRRPEMPLATMQLFDDGSATVTHLDNRHYHADELRDVARLLETFNATSYGRLPGIVMHDGRPAAWVDVAETRQVGNVQCFVTKSDDGNETLLVPHSADEARILLRITQPPEANADVPAWRQRTAETTVLHPERWNPTEVYRCLSVITECGVKSVHGDDWKPIRDRYRPVFDEGTWKPFLLECGTRKTRNGHEWKETRYRAELFNDRGWSICTLTIKDGGSGMPYMPFISGGEKKSPGAPEVAKWLNRNKIRLQPGAGSGFLMPSRPFPAVFSVNGRWHSAHSAAEVTQKVLEKVRVTGITGAEACCIMPLLPGVNATGKVAELTAISIIGWVKGWRRDTTPVMPGLFQETKYWHSNTLGRLDAALGTEVRRYLRDTDMKALGKVASSCLKVLCAGRKRYMDWGLRKSAIEMLQKWHPWIGDQTVRKSLKRILSCYGGLATDRNGFPDREWTGGLLERATALGMGNSLRQSLFEDISRWQENAAGTEDEAERLAELVEATRSTSRYYRPVLYVEYLAKVAGTMKLAATGKESIRYTEATSRIERVAASAMAEDEARRVRNHEHVPSFPFMETVGELETT